MAQHGTRHGPQSASTLGSRLLLARKVAGLTRAAVEATTGLSPTVLARYETDEREAPVRVVAKLAPLYGVEANALLTAPPAHPAPSHDHLTVAHIAQNTVGTYVARQLRELAALLEANDAARAAP